MGDKGPIESDQFQGLLKLLSCLLPELKEMHAGWSGSLPLFWVLTSFTQRWKVFISEEISI